MSVVSDALAALDAGRELLDDVGLRPYTVTVRVITHSGNRPGIGDKFVSDTPVTVGAGRRPKVTIVADKDVVAGGVLTKTRYLIENITPPFDGGGIEASALDPRKSALPTEIYYVLQGPGLPTDGMLCTKVSDKFDRVFGYSVTVESTGMAA